MIKKKLFTSLTAAFSIALLSTTVGCSNDSSGEASESNENKVVVWCWDQAFNGKALKLAEEIYQANNPDFELEIIDLSKTDLEQKLTTNLASGVTDSLPDIILVNDVNAQKYVESYPDTFADLTNAVDYSNFVPYKVQGVTVDSKIYGIPFDVGVTGLFYRTDYLEEAGFTAEDLENITWDEFIEIGKVVYEKTGKYLSTITPNGETIISIMLQSAGSWYISSDNKGNFTNNEVMTETMRIYNALATSGVTKPVTGWSEFVSSFNNGDVAAVISGVWQIATIMDGTDQSGKWAVAPTPRLNISNGVNASNEGGSSWFVLDVAENKELAIDFLASTLGSSTELYEKFLDECGGIGSYLPAFESEIFAQEVEFFGGQQVYKLFADWLTEVPSISFGTYTQEAKDALKNELPNIINNGDIEKSLENAQSLYTQQVQ
ncbi:ABC transporter substrate-binding protein [Turicibacter sp. H121]|uniref:ABC transporter substrate-binding protein n=1 Tax=Turicibacter sp. H121 TaxID=1712675 RepID=UPI000762F87E|nr:extracellular solute-binding protein [Turicibacter sp. H121]AMC08159.1 ABC transporter substrate-binding protein [Turicibacter sp. H121]MCU7199636.1 extracellular solute-binding protein [Turicibacter sp. H121]